MVIDSIISMLISWLVPSIIAAIGIMLSSKIIEHNLEFKRAIVMALLANILPIIVSMFFGSFFFLLPFGSVILTLFCWIILALIIMSDMEMFDRVKVAILGFVITEIIWFILPFFGI